MESSTWPAVVPVPASALATLSDSGLVTAARRGNQKHYKPNQHSPIFGELHAIVQKTIGVAESIRHALVPLAPHITAALFMAQ